MSSYINAILVVEDDPTDQFIIEGAFRANGATQIHTVASEQQAIAYLDGRGRFADREQFPFPSFIIAELDSPGVNGLALLKHLRKNPQWAAIPTVVFTACSDPGSIRRCYELGARSFHVKRGSYAQMHSELRKLHRYWTSCEVPGPIVPQVPRQSPAASTA